jgi:hypothetical protein
MVSGFFIACSNGSQATQNTGDVKTKTHEGINYNAQNPETVKVTEQIKQFRSRSENGDPDLGSKVMVFDPSMDMVKIQTALDAVHDQQKYNQFTAERYALLFKPGKYKLIVNVDYYVQAAGLGMLPGDVVIEGAVQSKTVTRNNNVTTMFWRSAENLLVDASEKIYWAVSQAAPLRRMHIKNDLQFDRGGWASGGFLANSIVEGSAGTPSGQQWFTRNSRIDRWVGAAWNATFVGVENAPQEQWGERPYTVVDKTPIVREKPFLAIDKEGDYGVFVPDIKTDVAGVSWDKEDEEGRFFSVNVFYIAKPEVDDAASINAALKNGKHLLLTPGVYKTNEAIQVSNPDTMILGLGLATIMPQTGKSALRIADVGGVIVAGIMVDAGPVNSPVLLQIGERGSRNNHATNPTTIHDVYCRGGGPAAASADICVEINSSHVIADHFWLWRADHGVDATWEDTKSKNGIIVNGDDVTIYGLFNEHFQEYQTLWNGERGETYFYQCEIPYDPPTQQQWMSDSTLGYAGYKVAEGVQQHKAFGLGIYSFFYNDIVLENAIETPQESSIEITNTVNFSARQGGIKHHLNGNGISTYKQPAGARFYKWPGDEK